MPTTHWELESCGETCYTADAERGTRTYYVLLIHDNVASVRTWIGCGAAPARTVSPDSPVLLGRVGVALCHAPQREGGSTRDEDRLKRDKKRPRSQKMGINGRLCHWLRLVYGIHVVDAILSV